MPLFLNHKFLFIHIPKTGGSSVTKVFKDNGDAPLFISGFINGHSAQHTTYKEYKKLNLIPPDFRIFTVIRNPYERFVSEYNYRKKEIDIEEFAQRLFLQDDNWDNHNLSCQSFIDGGKIELIRFENLKEDFKKVTGLDMNIHEHKSKKIIIIEDLTERHKNLIYKHWRKDFKYY